MLLNFRKTSSAFDFGKPGRLEERVPCVEKKKTHLCFCVLFQTNNYSMHYFVVTLLLRKLEPRYSAVYAGKAATDAQMCISNCQVASTHALHEMKLCK